MAEARPGDARLLLEHRRASNAYDLAGYSVEIALKASIARQIAADTIPDKDLIRNVYSHEFMKLVGLAGLSGELRREQPRDRTFAVHWAVADEWLPDARYRSYTMFEAQALLDAIEDAEHGVMQFTGNTFNGYYLPDRVVLRMDVPRRRPQPA